MRVCLVTEGTYPVHPGGVSDWCDQLVRGLPEVEFAVVALTGSGREPARYRSPANLVAVDRVGLWAPPPRRRRARAADHRFVAAYAHLLEAVLRDGPGSWFAEAVRELRALAGSIALTPALRSQAAVELVTDVARRVPNLDPTLADALAVTDLMEHFLRPLQLPAPRADLVHATANGPAALVGLLAKWEHETPLLLSEHGVYLRERLLASRRESPSRVARAAAAGFYARLTELGYRGADEVLPVSRFNARWARRGGARAVRVLPNGVHDLPVLEAEPEVPTIVFAGRIDPLKDLHLLLRAFGRVRERVPQARLRLFGGTPEGNEAYAASCRALAAELGLAEVVDFAGPVSPVTRAFEAGHVVVLSSLSEGLPLTIIEAAMSGRATVATDVGGMAEAVGPGGIVVPAGDEVAFAEACVSLLTDAERRAELGAKGRAHALAHFTRADFLAALREIYAAHTEPAETVVAPAPERPRPRTVADVVALRGGAT
jgi:glycosyltransferase involved in cell wall biosynthesis